MPSRTGCFQETNTLTGSGNLLTSTHTMQIPGKGSRSKHVKVQRKQKTPQGLQSQPCLMRVAHRGSLLRGWHLGLQLQLAAPLAWPMACMCVSLWMLAHVYRYLWRSEEGIRFPEAEVTGTCKPPAVGAGNTQQVMEEQLLTTEPSLQPKRNPLI